MLPEARRRQLLEYLSHDGSGNVEQLATLLEVSPATIRRDLQQLEKGGHLKRTHGGAVLPHLSTAFEPLYGEKKERQIAEKRAIAKLASTRVEDGQVVILDSGSTTLALAMELKKKRNLTVITTDLKIALEMSAVPGCDVIIVGGKVRPQLYSVIGAMAEQALQGLHANHAFLGADAIDLHVGVTNANLEEIAVKQRAIASARAAILLADHSKFGKVSLAKVAALTVFHEVISDWGLDGDTVKSYGDTGIILTLARKEI
jgi:DeoR family transcriptional regulator, fructose operon transcriptional repressor